MAERLVSLVSAHSVEETIARVRAVLAAKQIAEFCLIDHSGAAAGAGLTMPNTKVIVFGNPKAGTPLMLAEPGIAIDLPLKLLVREDAVGQVRVEFERPESLLARHGMEAALAEKLKAVEAIAAEAAR